MAASADVLSTILLCGTLGAAGQLVRAIVGLKNMSSTKPDVVSQQTEFSAAYLVVSLLIGATAGILAGFALGLQNIAAAGLTDDKTLLGIAASGYLGADFVENSMSLIISGRAAPAHVTAPPAASLGSRPQIQSPVAHGSAIASEELRAALASVAPRVDQSRWIGALQAAFSKFGFTTDKRIAAALGQFLVEAGAGFQETVENLNYTSSARIMQVFGGHFASEQEADPYVRNPEALANRVYANILGNRDEASGDGYHFRGRGLIQLTGRGTYNDFGRSVGMSAEDAVILCETPEGAALSGCWYLVSRGCLPDADRWDIDAITRKVNGVAMLDHALRASYAQRILKILGGTAATNA